MVSSFFKKWERTGWSSVALLLLTVLAAKPVSAADQWLYAKTEHFEIVGNAHDWQARDLVVRLEEFRESFLKLFPGAPFRDPRTTVVLFRSDRSFNPYKPLYKGKPKEISGICSSHEDEVVIGMSTEGDFDRTLRLILHEYVHLPAACAWVSCAGVV